MSFKSIEGASSSSSSRPSWKYDVFVSFRGEDTRKNFTDHLCSALKLKGINFFRDNEKLERGKPISQELLKAIEASRFSIVVFSTNYATSSWCLDELLKIVECMKEIDQTVVPIFYDVEPTDVRKQTGIFGKAFDEHEKAFGAEKVEKWRAALTEVANLSGHDLQDGHQASFIEKIVEGIWTKLSNSFSSVAKDLVGMDSHLKEMFSYLNMGMDDVRIIGICGMGGIGKTTIAKVIYDKFFYQFEGCSFISNIKEVHKKYGVEALQEKLLSQILVVKDINILHVHREICNRIRNRRVLVILDDIDELEQLERLAGDREWFGPGSRIIVTTRDEHLLIAHHVDKIYKVDCLDKEKALQLFSLKAFKQNHIPEDHVGLFKDILSYCDGLPLALVVLGSVLCGLGVDKWRSALERLKQMPMEKIFGVLKMSYDSLEGIEKKIFLDFSCVLNSKRVDRVIEILEAFDFHPKIGLQALMDKSLVDKHANELHIHSLLKQMAQTIVCQESPSEPGKRSRLWLYSDIRDVLLNKKGTEAVELIYLSSSQLKDISIDADAFVGMNNLRLLKIKDVQLPNGLGFLPNELRILKWHGYPLKSLPSTFKAEKLVELDMSHSGIQLLWKERVHLDRLKAIKLSHSRKLTRIPDLSGFSNLERLILEGCTSLYEIHPSIGDLRRLILLNLKDCENLRSLPKIVSGWRFLKFLLLLGCLKIQKLPENLGDCEDLEELDAGKTAIREAPSSIVTLKNLKKLSFYGCKGQNLKYEHCNWFQPLLVGGGPISMTFSLPSQIAGLLSLTKLNLSYCNLSAIPRDTGNLSALTCLNLRGNEFVSLPTSFNQLSKLESIDLADCKRLQTLPELPSRIRYLDAANCSSLKTLIGPLGLPISSGRAFYFENCFRLLENKSGEDFGLSLLKQHLLVLTKIRIREIFSHFLDISEKQESNDPHISRLAKFIRSWMSYLRQEASASQHDLSRLGFVLPGTSISDWFTFQTTNDWIAIELPPNLCSDSRFLGLAVCASFRVKVHEGRERKVEKIEVTCSANDVCQGFFTAGWYLHKHKLPVSDFLWLGFMPSRIKYPPEMDSRTVKDKLSIRASCFELKKCGIRAVYLKDIEFIQTMFQGLHEPRLEDIIQLSRPQAAESTIFERSHDAHFYSDDVVPSGTGSDVDDWASSHTEKFINSK